MKMLILRNVETKAIHCDTPLFWQTFDHCIENDFYKLIASRETLVFIRIWICSSSLRD